MSSTQWTLAERAHSMNPSAIREILKVTERPNIISFAGGLPAPSTFPVEAFAEACAKVLRDDGRSALQYAASEGLPALREYIAAHLPWSVDPSQVLITTGSQQALDLAAKIFIDKGSRILVETPSYLGALQAFSALQPQAVSVDCDDEGPIAADMAKKALGNGSAADKARFVYLLPNFQNPTGRTISAERRKQLAEQALALNLPVLEDNPYGDLWFDAPPPAPLASVAPDNTLYMGSFSKVLAPGLRLGFLVAPQSVYQKLLQAKQAADLHTPSFNQRVVAEIIKDGFLDQHVPTIRTLYKAQCHAMLQALSREMAGLGVQWNQPAGGMFLWVRLPEGLNASTLLPQAVERNVAFVPGSPFFVQGDDPRSLRLSFVTATVEQINTGIHALAETIRAALGQIPSKS